jgi:hypothetical protein
LEYLDVFDLFNFPRAPMPHDASGGNGTHNIGQPAAPDLATAQAVAMIPNFAVPNPEADWLFQSE